MSKWSYLSPLLTLSVRLLQSEEAQRWLRRVGQQDEGSFHSKSNGVGGAVDTAVDHLLGAMNLQRRPSTAMRIGRGLTWAGLGAAAAAGGLLASQVDRAELRARLAETGTRVSGAASRSAQWLERRATGEWLEMLDRVGLQPKPAWSSRALHTGAWLGAGGIVGAAAVAYFWARSSRAAAEQSTAEVAAETEATAGPISHEADANSSEQAAATAGSN